MNNHADSTMTFSELITLHRDYYVSRFQNNLQTADYQGSEVLLDMKNDETEELFRLYRYDLVNVKDGEVIPTEFNVDGYLDHDVMKFVAADIEIEVSPIFWNGCEIFVDNNTGDLTNLLNWIKKWIDIDEKHEIDSLGCYGVIHNVTRPRIENGFTAFTVDFGTAPVDALTELVVVFRNDGITKKIRIGSPTMTQ